MITNLNGNEAKAFPPLTLQELTETLGITIKKDESNKIITFLCFLSAFTENSQFNISYNAPSSSGKSYIPLEIALLFPPGSVVKTSYCSPTAFFHEAGDYDAQRKIYMVDLSRKILIFLDQPHTQLLQRLRPLLSHDDKEISIKITDKVKNSTLRTKNVVIRGYPSVTFCSAGLRMDEQEATRLILLSPETTNEKIRESLCEKLKKETDSEAYRQMLASDPKRLILRDRIEAIKVANINDIKLTNPGIIRDEFLRGKKMLKPRHMRDLGRLTSLIKAFALLNLWHRERVDNNIIANNDDIQQALKIWNEIYPSQELNLPPYVYVFYQDIIDGTMGGLTRQDILRKHREAYDRPLADWKLRREILPMLEDAGLIYQEEDPSDKRIILVYPTMLKNRAK